MSSDLWRAKPIRWRRTWTSGHGARSQRLAQGRSLRAGERAARGARAARDRATFSAPARLLRRRTGRRAVRLRRGRPPATGRAAALGPTGTLPQATAAFRIGEGWWAGRRSNPRSWSWTAPDDYLRIRSGSGKAARWHRLCPLARVGKSREFSSWRCSSLHRRDRELLTSVGETLAIALEVARSRRRCEISWRTRQQAERLANQEHELTANTRSSWPAAGAQAGQ